MDLLQKYAYLAGLTDGDGCISISVRKDVKCKRGVSFYMSLKIASINLVHLEVLKEEFGGSTGSAGKVRVDRVSQVYQWNISGKAAALLLTKLYPFLLNKKDQAELAINFQERLSAFTGHSYPDLEYNERMEIVRKIRSLNNKKNLYLNNDEGFEEPEMEGQCSKCRAVSMFKKIADGNGYNCLVCAHWVETPYFETNYADEANENSQKIGDC